METIASIIPLSSALHPQEVCKWNSFRNHIWTSFCLSTPRLTTDGHKTLPTHRWVEVGLLFLGKARQPRQPNAAVFVLKSIAVIWCLWAQLCVSECAHMLKWVGKWICFLPSSKPERTIHPLESDILIFVLKNISVKNNNLPFAYPRLILFTWLNYWREDQFFPLPLHNSSVSLWSSASGRSWATVEWLKL